MKKYLLPLFITLLFSPKIVKASCDNITINKLKKIANNINYTYDYLEENDSVNFNITLVNLDSRVKIYDVTKQQEYSYDYEQNEMTYNDYVDGYSHKFVVYPSDPYCSNEVLRSFYVELPSYNRYYKNEVCKGYETLSYCQKWQRMNISEEEFVYNVELAKEKIEKPLEEKDIYQVEENIGYSILEFYAKYYFVILPLILSLIIVLKINKNNKIRKEMQ